MKKAVKYFLIFLGSLAALIIVLLLLMSPIAKYEIEKNSVAWTGRKISIGNLSINLFGGSVDLKNVKICEAGNDSAFFGCDEILLRMSIRKILGKEYEVEQLKIDAPRVHILQNGNKFNFDDLVKRFSSPKDTTKKAVVHYYIDNVSLNNGIIYYDNRTMHNSYRITDINLNLPELGWDKPETDASLNFKSSAGGAFNTDLQLNLKTQKYNLLLSVDKYDLSQYYTPMRTLINISSLKGFLTTRLRIHGKFNTPEDISIHGFVNLDGIELKDGEKKEFFAMRKLSLDVDSIDVKHNHFDVNHLILDHPYIVFDNYENGNNYSRMFKSRERMSKPVKDTARGKSKLDYTNIFTLLESSVKSMTIDMLHTNYHADSIAIRNGEFHYNDLTPDHPFHYKVTKFNLVTSELSDLNEGVRFHASAKLGDSGKFIMRASIDYNRKRKKVDYKLDTLKFTDLSPIANYVLEKNSVKWVGRRVTAGKIKVNAVKGSVFVKNINIYEADGQNLFFTCRDVYFRMNLLKLLDKEYYIEKLKFDNPEINIIQNGTSFNYDDIMKHFASAPGEQTDTAKPVQIHYVVDSVLINHANITYNNVPMHNVLKIMDFNFKMPEARWDKPWIPAHLDFKYGAGGTVGLDLDFNRDKSWYNSTLVVDKCDLSQYYTPLKKYLKVSSFNGWLSANLRIHGMLNSPTHIKTAGSIRVGNLALTDSANRKVFGFDELALNIDTINVKHNMYYIRNIALKKPFMLFDYYNTGNNISNLILTNQPSSAPATNSSGEVKADYSNIFTLLSSTIKMMATDFFNTDYHTDSITITDGKMLYNDYTLDRDFHLRISNFSLSTGQISAANKSIAFNVTATLNDAGKMNLKADMSPDMKNMTFAYDINNFRLLDVNPYMEYYTGTPFINGYLDYHSIDSVMNRNLKSTNDIHIKEIEMGKKVMGKPVYHLPIRFAVSLLKDDKGNIDLKIPATGNLDDPNYKIGKVVGRLLTQLVVKTAESPFKHLAKLFKWNAEDMKQFQFEYLQEKLTERQLLKLNDVHKVLDRKKEMDVEITQVTDSDAECDELALALAKKQYYRDTKHVMNDSMISHRQKRKEKKASKKITITDTLFNNYLNEKLHLTGNELIETQDKCRSLIGEAVVQGKVHELMEKRNKEVSDYLIRKKELNPQRIKISYCTDSLKIQNLSQPEFDINYTMWEK